MNLKKILLATITILSVCTFIFPVEESSADESTAADFLKLDPSAQSAGFGSAYVAKGRTSLGMYFNPAALAQLGHKEAQYTNMDLFAGIGYQNIGYSQPIHRNIDSFGINITTLDFGTQQRTQIRNNDPVTGLGSFGAEDISLSMSYGRAISNKLDGGLSLKFVQSDIAGFSDGTISGDLGLHYESQINGLSLGIAARNLFGNITLNQRSDPLPRQFAGGLYYKHPLQGGRHSLHFGASGTISNNGNDFTSFGIQYEYYQRGFLRVGHRSLQDADDGFTFGLGVHFQGFKIDYAFVPFGNLGNQQRFSIAYQFGGYDEKEGTVKETKDEMKDTNKTKPVKKDTKKEEKTDFSRTPTTPVQTSGEEKQQHTVQKKGEISVMKAVSQYNAGYYAKAHETLSTILSERPDHIKALLWIGKLEYELGARNQAVKRFERVLKIDPDNKPARRNLRTIRSLRQKSSRKGGNTNQPNNKATKTKKTSNRTTKPQTKTNTLKQGKKLFRQENYAEARKQFLKAHRNDPDGIKPLLWLGRTEHRMGKNRQARERMLRILRMDPDHEKAMDYFLNWD